MQHLFVCSLFGGIQIELEHKSKQGNIIWVPAKSDRITLGIQIIEHIHVIMEQIELNNEFHKFLTNGLNCITSEALMKDYEPKW